MSLYDIAEFIEHEDNKDKVILDLCGGTGGWSKPYRDAGYTVYIVDPSEHMMYDARLWPSTTAPPGTEGRLPKHFLDLDAWGEIHGVLAAPVCTVFANSGARWPRTDADILQGLSLVDACIRIAWAVKPKWWALENPVGKLTKWLGPPRMSFNPCDYGDAYTKKTLLWGDFNTDLPRTPVEPERVCSQGSWVQKLGGKSDKTKRLRSATPPGFAQAFFEANP